MNLVTRNREKHPTKISQKDVIRFLREVLPELEKLNWVQRYCWYRPHRIGDPKMGPSILLNDVGEYFASVWKQQKLSAAVRLLAPRVLCPRIQESRWLPARSLCPALGEAARLSHMVHMGA